MSALEQKRKARATLYYERKKKLLVRTWANYPTQSIFFYSSFSSFRTAPQEASGDRLQSSCSTNQRSVDTVWTRSIEHVLCCLHMGNMAIEISDNFITLLKVSATVLHTLSAMHLS